VAERLLAYYGERVKPVDQLHHTLRSSWLTRIRLRLREGWAEADLQKMFDGCAADEWTDRWKWNNVTDILKDRASMERFLTLAEETAKRGLKHASDELPQAGGHGDRPQAGERGTGRIERIERTYAGRDYERLADESL